MSFGPKRTSLQDIALSSLGGMISGLIASIIILIIVFGSSSIISIPGTFEQARLGLGTNGMFPFILSFITFIATTVMILLTYKLFQMIHPEKYKKSLITYGQISFFGIFTYIFFTPVYITTGLQSYDNIMIVFIVHSMVLAFGTSILIELLNNYRYILMGIYGSFVGLFVTAMITLSIFSGFSGGYAKLISLLVLLPIINTCIILFKELFEFLYYKYNQFTNLDQLGDIFHQIEEEEKELLREEEEKNSL